MITAIFTKEKSKIFRVDAVLTNISKSKNKITDIMKKVVKIIDTCGV